MTHFYRMPTFATLEVHDLRAAARWYHDTLGFRFVFEIRETEERPALIHLRRAHYQDLLLVSTSTAAPAELRDAHGGIKLTFRVEEDVDALADQATDAGAHIVEGPVDTLWNAREVTFQDLDGYRLTFSRFSWIPGLV
ncbi:MAG: VOC family protein [Actinomycetota bacterium]